MGESRQTSLVAARIEASALRHAQLDVGGQAEIKALLVDQDQRFSQLSEQLPGASGFGPLLERLRTLDRFLAESLSADCADASTLSAWGTSTVLQEGQARPLVEDALLRALGEGIGATPDDGSLHAGLVHLYGYLLSGSAADRYGPKRLRWTAGEVGSVLGGTPDWPFAEARPLLRCVTERLLAVAPLHGWVDSRDLPEPASPDREAHLEFELVEASADEGWVARTRLFRTRAAPNDSDPALLVYSVRLRGEPERYITCFLVSADDVERLRPPDAFRPASHLRYNAVLPREAPAAAGRMLSTPTSAAQSAVVVTFKLHDELDQVQALIEAQAIAHLGSDGLRGLRAASLELADDALDRLVDESLGGATPAFVRDASRRDTEVERLIPFEVRSASVHRFEVGASSSTVLAVEIGAPLGLAKEESAGVDGPPPSSSSAVSWVPKQMHRGQLLPPIMEHHLFGGSQAGWRRREVLKRFRSTTPQSGWSVGDFIDVNHLVAHRGSDSAWSDLFDIAQSVSSSLGNSVRLDSSPGDSTRSLSLLHMPGCDAGTAERVAEALATGKPSSEVVGMGSDSPGPVAKGTIRRSDVAVYFASYSASGMVVTPQTGPDGTVLPNQNYWIAGLPGQFTLDYLTVYLYAVHQRIALLDLSDRLAQLSMLRRSSSSLELDDDELDAQVEEVSGIEIDLQRLLAWSRFREVSSRPGIQLFYDHLAESFRLEALEHEVDTSASGSARVLRMQLAQVERESNEKLESWLKVAGGMFAVFSLLVALVGANWDGLTVEAGGLPVWLFVVLCTTIVGVGIAALVVWWLRRLRRAAERRDSRWQSNGLRSD